MSEFEQLEAERFDLRDDSEQVVRGAPGGTRASLDAIHLASARHLGSSVRQIVTYDERMADAARAAGWSVASPR